METHLHIAFQLEQQRVDVSQPIHKTNEYLHQHRSNTPSMLESFEKKKKNGGSEEMKHILMAD